jgi:hypothetical protein
MTKLVTVDAQTIAGNPWLKAKGYLSASNQIKVPAHVMDADGGVAFYISQLAGMEATLYETPYADITYLEDVPVAAGIAEYATHWNYRSYDGVTMGKFISANASDLPRVAQSAKMHQVELGYAGVECHYSLDELRTTSAMNMPIDSMQSELAYRGSEEHSQRVAYFGDTGRGMDGLFNNPNVTKTSATVALAAATGQQLFDMLNDPIFAVIKLSKKFHNPNSILMFPDLWKKANSTLMTGYTDRTVMEHFMINNAYTLMTGQQITIRVRFQLEAAELAAGGVSNSNKDRFMVYDKNDRNLALAKPIPFRMLAPQLGGLGISVPCEYKMSGTEFRYPMAAMYIDML